MQQVRHAAADPRYCLQSVSADKDNRRLCIEWGDGHVSRFPFIWLRHAQFFPVTGRPGQPEGAPCLMPERPEDIEIGNIGSSDVALEIQWRHDGNTTHHDLGWLRDNCLTQQARRARQPLPELWTAGDAARIEWFEAGDLDDPAKRLELFCRLRDHGLVLLRNVPIELDTVSKMADYFGPIRRTHHGTQFDIRSLPIDRRDARDGVGATAANGQAPHTDEAFFHGPPGISLFHCIKPDPSGGGASLFVDGVAAAETLRERDPAAFAFLTSTPVLWAAERNPMERFRTRARVIATDSAGVVRGIRLSDRTMPPLDLPEEQVEEGYAALRAFAEIAYAPERVFEVPLAPGDMAVFDNHRVLHARRAFDQCAGERHLQQVEIDREMFHNVFRQLAEQVGRFDLAHWESDAGALSQ